MTTRSRKANAVHVPSPLGSPVHSPIYTPSQLATSPVHSALQSPVYSPSSSPPATITTPIPGTPVTGRSGYTGFTGYANVPRGVSGARGSVAAASWGVSARGSVRSPTPAGSDVLRAGSPFLILPPQGLDKSTVRSNSRRASGVLVEEELEEDESGLSSLPQLQLVAQDSFSKALVLAPPPGGKKESPMVTTVELKSKGRSSGAGAAAGAGAGAESHGLGITYGTGRESRHLTLDREVDLSLLVVNSGPYIDEDQSDAPWKSYKPTIRPESLHGLSIEEDSISLLRSKMYEILDDKTYCQQLYFLQCEYGKLPSRPIIPVALDGEHTTKAQVFFGIGTSPSIPALFWSSSQYFVRAVFCLAQAHCLSPAAIYAHTARIRRDMTYLGAFVGWLPLDFGVWRGKNDLDPERGKYLVENFPGIDEYWAFWYPMWSREVLTKHGVTNISFGPAPSPQPPAQPLVPVEQERVKSPVKKLSRADKIKRRASTCHTQ